ncbi:GNAT family N-acetyltransferase [Gorillibacterium sp. CAU 1737]|uniref:GNAT family N-acetyltransferase n=1 Tax=Gorillibacterium sp. CAU 1737 TaxID=3140362 RepID=UPI0032616D37
MEGLKNVLLRNPKEEDVDQVGELDFVLKLHMLYHGDFDRQNMVCAFSEKEELLAVASLTEHDTFHAVGHEGDPAFVRHLMVEITLAEQVKDDNELKSALVDQMIQRAREIKEKYPDKRIVLAQYIDTDDLTELDFFFRRGFTVFDTIAVFKYDLSADIPSYPLPEGVRIVPYALDHPEALNSYHQAELASFDGVAWSLNHLGWMQGAPEVVNFCAFHGDHLIGNTSTWKITDERSATENVFVVPEWQKHGIARGLLSTALQSLKQQGKTIATLGTQGTNRKAIRLYTQVGYEFYGSRFTMGYEIDAPTPVVG